MRRPAGDEPVRTPDQIDNLAQIVQAEWLGEVAARQLRDPRVLPLSWSSSRGALDQRPGRIVRDRLAGRMDGRFDDVVGQLADGYRQIPSGRLVALGAARSARSTTPSAPTTRSW